MEHTGCMGENRFIYLFISIRNLGKRLRNLHADNIYKTNWI